jgi:hypothetical protein
MGTKLNVDPGSDIGKKLWEIHQENEYTHVTNYKEAICINCFKKDAASATIADICGECAGKRGREPLLATITQKKHRPYIFCVIVASNGSLPRFPAHSPHISAIVAEAASFLKQFMHIASL